MMLVDLGNIFLQAIYLIIALFEKFFVTASHLLTSERDFVLKKRLRL